MQKPKNNSPVKKRKKAHYWRNFPEGDKDAIKVHEQLLSFEDSTVKARMVLARKYNVKYHPPYFTKVVLNLKKEKT